MRPVLEWLLLIIITAAAVLGVLYMTGKVGG